MLDPTSLFSYESHLDPRTIRSRVLVVTLGNFADIGHAQAIVDNQLMNTLPSHQLGSFDVDQLYDYSGHRPLVLFDKDHFTDFNAPQMRLHQLTDSAGERFLLLSGPEPALQWERMAASIEHLIASFDVQLTVLLTTIPAPTPHTRPVFVSRFGSHPGLVSPDDTFAGVFQLSSSFGTLLSVRLGEAGHDVIGLVAHLPNYLADTDYPEGAISLLNSLRQVAGFEIPSTELTRAAEQARSQIDAQVSQSEELTQMVTAMESNYEQFMHSRRLLPPAPSPEVPSADEIGREVEDFLKSLDDDTPPAEDHGPEDPGQGDSGETSPGEQH